MKKYSWANTPIELPRWLALGLLLMLILFISLWQHEFLNKNNECPPGFTCTKNPEPCWEVVIGNYEMGLVYPQLQNKDSLSEKELTLALYRGVYKNGTEIPRCET